MNYAAPFNSYFIFICFLHYPTERSYLLRYINNCKKIELSPRAYIKNKLLLLALSLAKKADNAKSQNLL